MLELLTEEVNKKGITDPSSKASLYQTFPPEKAYELAKRLEIHYTPKYGSWLNIAEIELNTMTRQYLDRRIDDIHKLEEELSSYASLI